MPKSNSTPNKAKLNAEVEFGVGRNRGILKLIKWLLAIIIFILLLFVLSSPLRGKAEDNFVNKGDDFLASKKYLSADLAYQKALILNPKNQIAKARQLLVAEAERDITVLENFYNINSYTSEKETFEAAMAFPNSENAALKNSRSLIESGEYQLAIIPAKTATEMDSQYRDAWLYLGIANLKTAEYIEAETEVKNFYLGEAKSALQKAENLDSTYQPTKDFLSEANKSSF